ncbi:YciI family protein [Xylanimonas sp. McL0601]|uniref:YciI family protein n=1 Tax=Xylanimonas sp. McL0601 TaxID=3414739 RepID=UPI003CEAB527
MTKYLLIYRADPAAMAAMPEPTPEQMQEMASGWFAWRDRVGAAMVDFGDPTQPASEGADPTLGGYSIVQADSSDAAQGLLQDHPHTAMGGTIDVYEITPFMAG